MPHETDPPPPPPPPFPDASDVITITTEVHAAHAGAFVYTRMAGLPCFVWPLRLRQQNIYQGKTYHGMIFVVSKSNPGVRAHIVTVIKPHGVSTKRPYPFVIYNN